MLEKGVTEPVDVGCGELDVLTLELTLPVSVDEHVELKVSILECVDSALRDSSALGVAQDEGVDVDIGLVDAAGENEALADVELVPVVDELEDTDVVCVLVLGAADDDADDDADADHVAEKDGLAEKERFVGGRATP